MRMTAGMRNLNSRGRIGERGSWNSGNPANSVVAGKKFRMNRMRQRVEAVEESGRGRIQKLIADAEDASTSGGGGLLPTTPGNYFFQGHAVTRATPGGNDHFRIQACNSRCGDLLAGLCDKLASSGF